MRRPSTIWLVESCRAAQGLPNYFLAWRDGTRIRWARAGIAPITATESSTLFSTTTERDSIRDTFQNLEGRPCSAQVWDVSDWVGVRFPRMWRPQFGPVVDPSTNRVTGNEVNIHSSSATEDEFLAAELLFSDLRDVLSVVDPTVDQLSTHGRRLRHLLLRACTEVKLSWKRVVDANAISDDSPLQNATDDQYARLITPMKLADFTVSLTASQDPMEFSPFAGPTTNAPNQGMRWYEAHRMRTPEEARLAYVLAASAGVYVMLAAQFGLPCVAAIPSCFELLRAPTWGPHERYIINPFDGPPWRFLSGV